METRRPETGGEADPDVVAARRLLERHARTLERVPDPRKRRERAYGLLARNGFDSQLATELARQVGADGHTGDEVPGIDEA